MTLSDHDFVEAFEDLSLPADAFRHRDHLRLAWIYLGRHDETEALRLAEQGIRRYATHLGAAEKYHQTITAFWIRATAAARRESPDRQTFEAFLAANPELLDKGLIGRHFSREVLESARARSEWVEPDLRPLMAHATIG